MRITIKHSDYMDILMGTTGNGVAGMILPILQQKKEEGHEVVVIDDFTAAVVERL